MELSKLYKFEGFLWSAAAKGYGIFSKLVLAALFREAPIVFLRTQIFREKLYWSDPSLAAKIK